MNKYFQIDFYNHSCGRFDRCLRWYLMPYKPNGIQGAFSFEYIEVEEWLSFEMAWNDFMPFIRFGKIEFLFQLPRPSDWMRFFKSE